MEHMDVYANRASGGSSAAASAQGGMMKALGRCGAVVAAAALPLLGGSSVASAATPSPAEISKSITWVDVEFDAEVTVPFEDGTESTYSTEYVTLCTGWFASPTGHVATAGHCLEFDRGDLESLYEQVVSENEVDAGGIDFSTIEWEYAVSDPRAYVGQPSNVEGGPLSGEDPVLAQVLDHQDFLGGDNAVLKIANISGMPALPIAAERPQVGDDVTAIGFAGSVSAVADVVRQPPSFKEGSVSSHSTTAEGVPVTEINAEVSGGMSGGPTVNERGEVVGINSFGIHGETQAFNFITDTETMRRYMDDNGVDLNAAESAPVSNETSEAVVPGAAAERPATARVAQESQRQGASTVMVIALVVAGVLVVALAATLVLLRRRLRKSSAATSSIEPPGPPEARRAFRDFPDAP